jgi:fructuronate reductase
MRLNQAIEKRVIGSLGEAIAARMEEEKTRARLVRIFTDPGLQMCSFTVTEKGYALRNADGEYLSYVASDIENGPEHVTGAMGIVASLLYGRFLAGGYPLALVSMDNVSRNGEKLKFDQNGFATCPATGERYQLVNDLCQLVEI